MGAWPVTTKSSLKSVTCKPLVALWTETKMLEAFDSGRVNGCHIHGTACMLSLTKSGCDRKPVGSLRILESGCLHVICTFNCYFFWHRSNNKTGLKVYVSSLFAKLSFWEEMFPYWQIDLAPLVFRWRQALENVVISNGDFFHSMIMNRLFSSQGNRSPILRSHCAGFLSFLAAIARWD
jgi:hypothetical protein